MRINRNKCDICGVCVAVCPVDAVSVSEFHVDIDKDKCTECQNCLIACPAKAISSQSFEGINQKESEIDNSPLMGIKKEYDVVVVGAGPGGSVAARFVAENNVSVLLLERDRESGIPVRCAEGISSGGLEQFIDIKPEHISSKITRARLNTPDGNHLEMKSHIKGYILERRIFDADLSDLACEHGATMLTKADVIGLKRLENGKMKVRYRCHDKIREVTCKIVIGADGVESRVGRWAGLKTALDLNDISTSTQYTLSNINVDPELISFYFGNNIAPGGYVWIFPKSKTTANVGIGISGNNAKEKPAQAYLDNFVAQHFPEASISYTVFSGVPIAATLEHIVADNVMLVGDAARHVNPITGGGIKQAMIAGKLAGEMAVQAIRKENYSAKVLKKYQQEWDKALGSKHRFIYKIKEKVLVAGDERLNKIADICKGIPPEKMSLPDLFKAVVKGDPKMVAEMASAFVLSKINV